MAENEEGCGHFLTGVLIGGILGALAGLLFAPKPGKELRSELKERGGEIFNEAKEVYSESSAKARAIIDDAKQRAAELKREADRQLSEARQKAREILASGEKKSEGAGNPVE